MQDSVRDQILFMSESDFSGLDAKIVSDYWKAHYDITSEPIVRSYVRNDHYWTLTGDRIYSGQTTVNALNSDLLTEYNGTSPIEYIIFRPKGLQSAKILDFRDPADLEQLAYQSLNHPIIRVNMPVGQKSKTNGKSKYHLPTTSKLINVIYKFPELTSLQDDYVEDLFSYLCATIKSDQSNSCKSPTNTIIGEPVVQLTFERYPEGDYECFYLVFTILLHDNITLPDLSSELALDCIIALDEEQNLDDIDTDIDLIGINDDGDNAIFYQIELPKIDTVVLQ